MDLKEFIKETVSGICNASSELEDEGLYGAILNPPTDRIRSTVYEEGGAEYIYRRVESIEFDVAVTVEEETQKEGKAGLKVFSSEVGGGATKGNRNEIASRVKFTMSLCFPVTPEECRNRMIAEEKRKLQMEELSKRPDPKSGW
ncbi:hypothetical protein ABIE58_001946 [Roseovarius sp. MBR-78]|jgi:hypothetical protein|uniref:hypothetical protein n=1 Tax=Roseovarius sp. MBR-78 TaxID=3156460 RepID=UPI003390D8BD